MGFKITVLENVEYFFKTYSYYVVEEYVIIFIFRTGQLDEPGKSICRQFNKCIAYFLGLPYMFYCYGQIYCIISQCWKFIFFSYHKGHDVLCQVIAKIFSYILMLFFIELFFILYIDLVICKIFHKTVENIFIFNSLLKYNLIYVLQGRISIITKDII